MHTRTHIYAHTTPLQKYVFSTPIRSGHPTCVSNKGGGFQNSENVHCSTKEGTEGAGQEHGGHLVSA